MVETKKVIEEKVEMEEAVKKALQVQRKKFKSNKDGKDYWGYFLRGTIKGKDVEAYLVAPDNGGYTVLDIAFDGAVSSELVPVPYRMTNERGEIVSGYTYVVRCVDANGEIMDADIKPKAKSDKRLVEILLEQNGIVKGV